jgi:uncharacterized protein YbjT (DUF2867 family)
MDRNEAGLVTVFGGSGFVGTQVVQLLARNGHRIRVAVRRPDLAHHLRPLGDVGQIQPVQANIRNADSIARAVKGADIVINLVGIGFERGNQRFDLVNHRGAGAIAAAARAAGATHFVHMSAIGADVDSKSLYARSKGLGEAAVQQAFPEAIIMRPSLVFGQGDGFFNLIASLNRLFPVMPLIGGQTRFQPVYVGDVAEAFVAAAEGKVKTGRIYELGGPEVETYKALLERVQHETGHIRPLLPLSPGIAKLLALPLSLLPTPLLTADQVILLQADNVVSEVAIKEKRTLAAFGIAPTPMNAILPSYLWRFKKNGQFDRQTA